MSPLAQSELRSTEALSILVQLRSATKKASALLERVDVLEGADKSGQERILHEVCRVFKVTRAELLSKTKTRNISRPRHAAMHLMREQEFMGVEEIAGIFSVHHSAVSHGVITNKSRLKDSPDHRKLYESIKDKLNANVQGRSGESPASPSVQQPQSNQPSPERSL